MAKEVTHIINRIDRDPSILMGVTASEFNSVLWLALPVFFIFTIFFWVLFNSIIGASFSGLSVAMYVSFSALIYIAKIKRGKPIHWLPHITAIYLDKIGLKTAPFIYKTQHFHSQRD